jgi:hypothetical protein
MINIFNLIPMVKKILMCMGLVSSHFVYVKLKEDCLLPATNQEWRRYCTEEVAAWEFTFLDRQREFIELMKIEMSIVPVNNN